MRKITLIGCSGKENQRDKRNRKRQRTLTDFIHLLHFSPIAFATFTLYIDIFLIRSSYAIDYHVSGLCTCSPEFLFTNDECRLLLLVGMVISSRTSVDLGARWPLSPVFVLGV